MTAALVVHELGFSTLISSSVLQSLSATATAVCVLHPLQTTCLLQLVLGRYLIRSLMWLSTLMRLISLSFLVFDLISPLKHEAWSGIQQQSKVCIQTFALLYIAAFSCIPNCLDIMGQLSTGDYVIKFERNSLTVQLSARGI